MGWFAQEQFVTSTQAKRPTCWIIGRRAKQGRMGDEPGNRGVMVRSKE